MSLGLLAAAALAAERGETLIAEATQIVETLGGRPAGSPAGHRAQDWARDVLIDAGWDTRQATNEGFVLGCREGRSARVVLFLAHTDTVHADVPGANDNAAAMAVLAAVARDLPEGPETPRMVCLAFPDAEEVGLLGSRLLYGRRAEVIPHPLDQVMALDLVGRGELTHNGLGPHWTGPQLRALLRAAPAAVPWVYRALSHGRPELERSDHHWFGLGGIPSSHLMARAESGVLWPYHTASDTPETLEGRTLAAAYEAVWGVAHARPLPPGRPGGPSVVVPWTGIVVDGGLVAVGTLGLLGLVVAGRQREATGATLRVQLADAGLLALTTALGGAAGLTLASGGRPFGFALAGPVALAGWAGLAAGAASRGSLARSSPHPLAATLVTAHLLVVALGLVGFGLPLLAVPLVAAAAAVAWLDRARWGVQLGLLLVALWPGLYLVRGDAIRELAHHHLVPPWVPVWTAALVVLGAPLAVAVAQASLRVRQGILAVSLAVLAGSAVWAWTTPVMTPPWERGPVYTRPDRPPESPGW